MLIDHIFIFCDSSQEADALVNFGLTEGSGRIHEGIGTANRRFFFENFYLEILWVEKESEAKSVPEISIWERANHKNTGYSRYGLCLQNTADTKGIFENAIKWQPKFLAEGQSVDIITDEKMPWIFRFPLNRQKNTSDEPRVHPCGIQSLSKAVFYLPQKHFKETLNSIYEHAIVEFKTAATASLTLEFDNISQGKTKVFENFNLTIKY